MPTTYSPGLPGFPAPADRYDRENEAQFRRQLERTLLDQVTYIEQLIQDEESVATHVLATSAALGTRHTISGAAVGSVLRASAATAANFQRLTVADLDSGTFPTGAYTFTDGPIAIGTVTSLPATPIAILAVQTGLHVGSSYTAPPAGGIRTEGDIINESGILTVGLGTGSPVLTLDKDSVGTATINFRVASTDNYSFIRHDADEQLSIAGANGIKFFTGVSGASQVMRAVVATGFADAVSASFFQAGQSHMLFTGTTGVVLTRYGATAEVFVLGDLAYTSLPAATTTLLHLETDVTTKRILVLKEPASYSANAMELRSSADALLYSLSSAGDVSMGALTAATGEFNRTSDGQVVQFRRTGATNNPGLFISVTEATSRIRLDFTGSVGAFDAMFAVSGSDRLLLNGTALSSATAGGLTLGTDPASGGIPWGSIYTQGEVNISGSNPGVFLRETDSVDSDWSYQVQGGDIIWFQVNDARTVFTERMRLTGAGRLGVGGAAESGRTLKINTLTSDWSIWMEGDAPEIAWKETDAGVDGKLWGISANAGLLGMFTRSDAGSFGATFFQVTRSGTSVTLIDLLATNVDINGNLRMQGASRVINFDDDNAVFQRAGVTKLTLASASATFADIAIFPAATTSAASARFPHGSAPTTPTDGDVWTTTAGYFARVNGVTYNFVGAGSDPLLLGNGSAGAPTYSFSSDTDLGLYRSASDELGVSGNILMARDTASIVSLKTASGSLAALYRSIRSRGTVASPTGVSSGDNLAQFDALGHNTSGFIQSAVMLIQAAETFGVGSTGSRFIFQTCSVGASSLISRLIIQAGLQIGAPAGGDKGAGTVNAATALYSPVLDTASAVDLVMKRNASEVLTLQASGVALVGESASLARLRLRGFYTASPSDPPTDQCDIIIVDNGTTPVFRVRYNDAGTMKVGDLALV